MHYNLQPDYGNFQTNYLVKTAFLNHLDPLKPSNLQLLMTTPHGNLECKILTAPFKVPQVLTGWIVGTFILKVSLTQCQLKPLCRKKEGNVLVVASTNTLPSFEPNGP